MAAGVSRQRVEYVHPGTRDRQGWFQHVVIVRLADRPVPDVNDVGELALPVNEEEVRRPSQRRCTVLRLVSSTPKSRDREDRSARHAEPDGPGADPGPTMMAPVVTRRFS